MSETKDEFIPSTEVEPDGDRAIVKMHNRPEGNQAWLPKGKVR